MINVGDYVRIHFRNKIIEGIVEYSPTNSTPGGYTIVKTQANGNIIHVNQFDYIEVLKRGLN